jgi:hypothetical protein
MDLLEELKNRVRAKENLPDELIIRDDQFEQLARELNDLLIHPFTNVGKVTAEDLRINGCWVFGIPVLSHGQRTS